MKENPLIYEAMAAIMADVEPITKQKIRKDPKTGAEITNGLGYAFRGIDDVYREFHPLLVKHRVQLTAEILAKSREGHINKNGGTNFVTQVTVRYRFTATDGSNIATESIGTAMDSSDKDAGKAMSNALKNAMLQAFLVETDEANKDIEETEHLDSTPPPAQLSPVDHLEDVKAKAKESKIETVEDWNSFWRDSISAIEKKDPSVIEWWKKGKNKLIEKLNDGK